MSYQHLVSYTIYFAKPVFCITGKCYPRICIFLYRIILVEVITIYLLYKITYSPPRPRVSLLYLYSIYSAICRPSDCLLLLLHVFHFFPFLSAGIYSYTIYMVLGRGITFIIDMHGGQSSAQEPAHFGGSGARGSTVIKIYWTLK